VPREALTRWASRRFSKPGDRDPRHGRAQGADRSGAPSRARSTSRFAATFLQRHRNTTFYVDRAAGADLTRIATPGCSTRWTGRRARRARGRLAVADGPTAILKLTQRDYADTRCRRSSRATARRAQSTARSSTRSARRSAASRKLAARQAIICFSPHPDDDVISMGGILRKLVENENEITSRT
jgi:glucosamine-6-phosphate deaminase